METSSSENEWGYEANSTSSSESEEENHHYFVNNQLIGETPYENCIRNSKNNHEVTKCILEKNNNFEDEEVEGEEEEDVIEHRVGNNGKPPPPVFTEEKFEAGKEKARKERGEKQNITKFKQKKRMVQTLPKLPSQQLNLLDTLRKNILQRKDDMQGDSSSDDEGSDPEDWRSEDTGEDRESEEKMEKTDPPPPPPLPPPKKTVKRPKIQKPTTKPKPQIPTTKPTPKRPTTKPTIKRPTTKPTIKPPKKPKVEEIPQRQLPAEIQNVQTEQMMYTLNMNHKQTVRYAYQLIRSYSTTDNKSRLIGNLTAADELLSQMEVRNIFGGDLANPNYDPYYHFAMMCGMLLSRILVWGTGHYKNTTPEYKKLVKEELWELANYIKTKIPIPIDQSPSENKEGYSPAMLYYITYLLGVFVRKDDNIVDDILNLGCNEDQSFNDYYKNRRLEFKNEYNNIYNKTRKMHARDMIFYGVEEKQVTTKELSQMKQNLSKKMLPGDVLGIYKCVERIYQSTVNHSLDEYHVGAIPTHFV